MPTGLDGVVGSDGSVPLYEPEGRWTVWGKHEIWDGTVGNKRYVPKVQDYVIDRDTYTSYIVDSLDPVTLIPVLREVRPANMTFSFTETDILFGVGPGTQSDTYRVYIDKSVTPHVLAVDIRLRVAGTMAHHAKIFKGSDLTPTGRVVSKVFDNSGVLISEDIQLELVALDSHNNHSIKTVKVCHTTENLIDGELVTLVIYSDNGHVVSKRQLLVENTAFIRSVDASRKYISHISCETSFMSMGNDHLIEFPLNIPINGLNIMGKIHYSDGSVVKLPVDGTKFKMYGIEQFISSIPGQQVNLVLAYQLGPNETAYTGVSSDGKFITEPYTLKTINPNNSYAVKLFGYPFFINEAVGYEMRWWMYNLDRNIWFEVTPHVAFNASTGPFNPKGYGYLQRKSVSVNLKDVSGAFKPFVHTQVVDIVLNSIPGATPNEWTVSHVSVPGQAPYGLDVRGTKPAVNFVKIDCGKSTYAEWKSLIYDNIHPIINNVIESTPPDPTHFIIGYGGIETEYPVGSWNQELNMSIDVPINRNVTVRFIKKLSSGQLELGIAVIPIKV